MLGATVITKLNEHKEPVDALPDEPGGGLGVQGVYENQTPS